MSKYNRVIIVGNGFDLACGLKSSYHDFILDIIKNGYSEAIKKGVYTSEFFDLIYEKMNDETSDFDLNKIENENDFKKLINYFKGSKYFKTRYLNKLFQKIIYTDSKNWIDIESFYFKELRIIWELIKLHPEKENDLISDVTRLNEELSQISNALKKYLKSLNFNRNDFMIKNSSLTDRLYEKLRNDDIKYLPLEYKPENDPEKVLILNFNYTEFAGKYLSKNNSIYITLHGSLTDYSNDIVFGYGDDTNEIYQQMEASGHSEFLEKIKSFQYGRDEKYHKLLNFIAGQNFEVFILGHSCGLSDKTLLKTIFEHKNCYAIKAFHYGGETDHFYKRMAIARHFDDKISMRQKVLHYDQYFEVTQFK